MRTNRVVTQPYDGRCQNERRDRPGQKVFLPGKTVLGATDRPDKTHTRDLCERAWDCGTLIGPRAELDQKLIISGSLFYHYGGSGRPVSDWPTSIDVFPGLGCIGDRLHRF